MNEIQKKFIESPGRYLMHYNHNHDKLGRFARSNGSSGSTKPFDSYTDEEKSLMRLGDSEISDLERERRIASKKNIFERRISLKEINAKLAERAPKALEEGKQKELERVEQLKNKEKLEKEFKEISNDISTKNHNNSINKLKRDSDGVLNGNIHFGSSDDVEVFVNDESKTGKDLYNKISNDNKFENEMRKHVAEEAYEMYQGWNLWDDTSYVKDRIILSKTEIYKNTKCTQLQIEENFGGGADIVMIYNHYYGKDPLDYQRWLVTYDSKKKHIVESQPW